MKYKADQTSQKLRGGYYTPQNLADYVSKWVLSKNPRTILEPSCGDGVFIQAVANNDCDASIELSCFELFDTEASKALERCKLNNLENATVTEGDFLVWANEQLKKQQSIFDVVLGNPPFIRYQFLEKNFQEQAQLVFEQLDLKFTKHTNAWVPFLLSSLALLKKGGRMGMVIPSEISHVMHAQSLRSYLGHICSKIVIIDPKEIEIVLDRKMEREVPVRAALQLEVTEAHLLVGPVLTEPLFVRAIGPQAQVEMLDYIATESVKLLEFSEEVDLVSPLRHPERTRLVLSPGSVRIRADIQILAEDDLSGVPIKMRNGGNVQLRPDTAIARVKVRGGGDVSAQLDPIKDIELYVDYAEFQGDSLPIRNAEAPFFDVLSITPSEVNLVGD